MNTNSPSNAHFGGRTRYAMLAETLLNDIRSGHYPVGSLLPTESDLCREFDASRHTVREALRRLVDLGLLSRQAGVGTTVKSNHIASRYIQTGEDAMSLLRYARDVNLRITATEDVIATGELARVIGSKEGQAWTQLSGERFLSGDPLPIALTEIWIARAYRGVADDLSSSPEPIYARVERRYGVTTAEIRQNIEAIILPREATEKLSVAPGSPGLRVCRSYVSSTGEIYETAVSLHPGERFSYSSTFRITSGPGESA